MKLIKAIPGKKYLWGALTLLVAWQGYVFLRRDPVVWTEVERQAAVKASKEFVAVLEAHVPRKARIGVIHFINDPHDLVTQSVKTELAARDGWSVEDGSVTGKFFKDVSRTMLDATSVEEFVKAGKRVELDVLVGGKVGEFVQSENAGNGREFCKVVLETRVYELRAGKMLFDQPVEGGVAVADVKAARPFSLWWFAGWLLIVAALPWITAFATHQALEQKSNFISTVLVTGYIVLDILFYIWLVAFYAGGFLGVLMWLVLLAACGGYNWFVCEKVAQR